MIQNVTPMMQQYFNIKEQYKDCILLFRLGDFYEMFFEDAKIASVELGITLTGRDCGLEERAPMCGVPYHAVESYIAKLVKNGYKVAICDQTEDPAQAKGIVKREVVKIVTPGTATDAIMLDDKKNNYIVSVYNVGECFGLAAFDVSCGMFLATGIYYGDTRIKLVDEIAKYSPSEILVCGSKDKYENFYKQFSDKFGTYITYISDNDSKSYNDLSKLSDVKIEDCGKNKNLLDISKNAAAALIDYVMFAQKASMEHVECLKIYDIEDYMILDISSRRNLELTESMRDRTKSGTLLQVLDRTLTSQGSRLLRSRIEQPLINIEDITNRLDTVNELKDKYIHRVEIREYLKRIYDIERLTGRIVLGSANARDLAALNNSLFQIPYIRELLAEFSTPLLAAYAANKDNLEDISDIITAAIIDDPPVTIKDGGIIKDGYDEEVDRLRKIARNGKGILAEIEEQERQRTGIKKLKIGYTRVFGYYIDVTNSYKDLVPDNYIRKQTLAGSERYITEELKKVESEILSADEKLLIEEYNVFIKLIEHLRSQAQRLKQLSMCIAEIDFFAALADVAEAGNYCRPTLNDEKILSIKNGRHPVVEKMIGNGSFVPNDTLLNCTDDVVNIITGPNMAGKSTYMRQVALIVLMAQIGSFVPADAADIGIADRIFTRVGATDDLASGQSTFMVEMSEVANIVKNATTNSFIILDELGRGTSTFDGLSIAWAVTEYISSHLNARTLVATHYHELTELEGKIKGIKNYCITVKEDGEDIIFLRKIVRGGADESYGINVAKLAGVPKNITERADEILRQLEESDISKRATRIRNKDKSIGGQLDLLGFNSVLSEKDKIISELAEINLQELTPIEALNVIYKLQQKIADSKLL